VQLAPPAEILESGLDRGPKGDLLLGLFLCGAITDKQAHRYKVGMQGRYVPTAAAGSTIKGREHKSQIINPNSQFSLVRARQLVHVPFVRQLASGSPFFHSRDERRKRPCDSIPQQSFLTTAIPSLLAAFILVPDPEFLLRHRTSLSFYSSQLRLFPSSIKQSTWLPQPPTKLPY
jgi:hypothetical protein